MPEAWPTGVPFEVRPNSWRLLRPFRDRHETSFEDGNQRSRRSTTKNIATIGFSIVPMTAAQFAAFKAWVRDDLVDGTLPDGFTMKVWTGDGYETRTCHMRGNPPYEAQPEGFDQVSGKPYTVVSIPNLDVEGW